MNLNPHQIITALSERIVEIEKKIQKSTNQNKNKEVKELLIKKRKLEKQVEIIKKDINANIIHDKDTTNIKNLEEVGHLDLFLTIPRLVKEGGFNNYLVFNIDLQKNYFIDITSNKGGTELYCNAVSNYHLEEPNQLGTDKINILLERGWLLKNDDMESNFYHKIFSIRNKNDLKDIVDSILFLIDNVYSTKFSEKLKMRFYLG